MSSNDSLVNTLYAADCAYQCGCPERAIQIANPLANDSANPAVSLVAQTICLASHIASGRGEDAYNDLLHAIRGCRVGLRCKEDLQLYGVSMLCAMRIETLVVASIFDFDSFDEDVDMMPFEFKQHLGYLLSMRAMRQNKEQVAVGISYAHLRTFAKMDDLSRIRLNLVMAAGNMVQGDTNEAEDIFMHALAMAESSGIVMPFVETNYFLLGLPRHCQGASQMI